MFKFTCLYRGLHAHCVLSLLVSAACAKLATPRSNKQFRSSYITCPVQVWFFNLLIIFLKALAKKYWLPYSKCFDFFFLPWFRPCMSNNSPYPCCSSLRKVAIKLKTARVFAYAHTQQQSCKKVPHVWQPHGLGNLTIVAILLLPFYNFSRCAASAQSFVQRNSLCIKFAMLFVFSSFKFSFPWSLGWQVIAAESSLESKNTFYHINAVNGVACNFEC